MNVFLTGGTGFIGRKLVRRLIDEGHKCVVVSRSGSNPWKHDAVRVIEGNPSEPGSWQEEVASAGAVFNLAGEPLVDPLNRWTDARKATLRTSRVDTTRHVAQAIRNATEAPAVLVSSSAVGYYGDAGDTELDENSPTGNDFLAHLSLEWERAALDAASRTRVVLARTGMVLAPGGGVLEPLLPLFRLGLGGPWGSGKQWWPWIHMADEVGLLRFAMDHDISGAVNLTAPSPVTVNEFAKALGDALKRPSFLRAPEAALRLALGEAADALLASLRVLPRRALEAGYQFQFPTLEPALADLF